jgi:PIN domain nuclease of toxin-antitoxin system
MLWWVEDDSRLSPQARRHIADGASVCHVSVASAREMAIKSSLGKLKLAKTVQRYFADHLPANDFRLLAIAIEHVALVEALPFHHRDPFDRLLVAQARHEGLTLISRDGVFDDYGITRIW